MNTMIKIASFLILLPLAACVDLQPVHNAVEEINSGPDRPDRTEIGNGPQLQRVTREDSPYELSSSYVLPTTSNPNPNQTGMDIQWDNFELTWTESANFDPVDYGRTRYVDRGINRIAIASFPMVSNGSPHFLINSDGGVRMFVPPEFIAHYTSRPDLNEGSVWIVCGAGPSDPESWTPKLHRSLVLLTRWLCQRFRIPRVHPEEWAPPLGGDNSETQNFGIFGKDQMIPGSSENPGAAFLATMGWSEYIRRINAPRAAQLRTPGRAYNQEGNYDLYPITAETDSLSSGADRLLHPTAVQILASDGAWTKIRMEWRNIFMADLPTESALLSGRSHRVTEWSYELWYHHPATTVLVADENGQPALKARWIRETRETMADSDDLTRLLYQQFDNNIGARRWGKYSWRCRAKNAFGWGEWSPSYYFHYVPDVPRLFNGWLSYAQVGYQDGVYWEDLSMDGVYSYSVEIRSRTQDGQTLTTFVSTVPSSQTINVIGLTLIRLLFDGPYESHLLNTRQRAWVHAQNERGLRTTSRITLNDELPAPSRD